MVCLRTHTYQWFSLCDVCEEFSVLWSSLVCELQIQQRVRSACVLVVESTANGCMSTTIRIIYVFALAVVGILTSKECTNEHCGSKELSSGYVRCSRRSFWRNEQWRHCHKVMHFAVEERLHRPFGKHWEDAENRKQREDRKIGAAPDPKAVAKRWRYGGG